MCVFPSSTCSLIDIGGVHGQLQKSRVARDVNRREHARERANTKERLTKYPLHFFLPDISSADGTRMVRRRSRRRSGL